MEYKIKEVTTLKEPSESEMDVVVREYKEWRGKTRLLSDRVLVSMFAIVSLAAFMLYPFQDSPFLAAIFIAAISRILLELARSGGHQEGYFDGYFQGVSVGIDKALRIHKEDAEFLNSVATEY